MKYFNTIFYCYIYTLINVEFLISLYIFQIDSRLIFSSFKNYSGFFFATEDNNKKKHVTLKVVTKKLFNNNRLNIFVYWYPRV